MRLTVTPAALGRYVENSVAATLADSNVIGELLALQAKRRMDAGGDSEHKYPDLWGNRYSYRAGGQPLIDTRRSWQALNGVTAQSGDVVSATLLGPLWLLYHQHGFKTDGPNYIPLTNKGKIGHTRGANPLEEGLVELKPDDTRRVMDRITGQVVATERDPDYMMAWKGVTVPQRKVFNLPAEDGAEIGETIQQVIEG